MLIGDSVLVCSDIFPFVHLLIKRLLCTYYGPGTVPGVGDLRDIGSYPLELPCSGGDTTHQIRQILRGLHLG